MASAGSRGHNNPLGGLCFPTNLKRYAVHVFQVGRDLRTRRAGLGNYGPIYVRSAKFSLRWLTPTSFCFPTIDRAVGLGLCLGAIFTAFRLDPAVSNPREGSRSARRSDPTPRPKDKVPRRSAFVVNHNFRIPGVRAKSPQMAIREQKIVARLQTKIFLPCGPGTPRITLVCPPSEPSLMLPLLLSSCS